MRTFTTIVVLYSSLLTLRVEAHGSMNLPRPRNMGNSWVRPTPSGGSVNEAGCDAAACMWFNQGCCIGCDACVDTFNNFLNFTSACGLKEAPVTLPHYARTLKNFKDVLDFTRHHPWRSPGSAPVLDSCGLSGGSYDNNDVAGGYGNATIARKQGARGSELPALHSKWTLQWQAGTAVEVSWGVSANHGGGYQYRLCPADEPLTEECFQKTPLAFSGSKSWLRWKDGHEVEIDALRVTEGTFPAGSEWSRNPIPTCGGTESGFGTNTPAGCPEPQFPPPAGCNETCWGYQPDPQFPTVKTAEMPAIVDKVLVPADLPPGSYVISWRWDCEQTPQVWSACGDVMVV